MTDVLSVPYVASPYDSYYHRNTPQRNCPRMAARVYTGRPAEWARGTSYWPCPQCVVLDESGPGYRDARSTGPAR